MAASQLHEDYLRQDEVQGSTDRAFGVVFAVVFFLIAAWPLVRGDGVRLWALAMVAVFAAAALLRPSVLAPLNRLWFRCGLLLHRIVSPLVLGVIFFAVITPIGLVMRLVGSRPLKLDFDEAAESYWSYREPPGPDPKTMKRQF